jgi:hypothetical protein
MTEQQREAARLLAQGIPATHVARQVGTSVRNLSRWKNLPDFAAAVQAAAASTPEPAITDATPVEQLRALAKSPREDIALRASSKLADLEQKAAAEQLANAPQARGATIYVKVFSACPAGEPPEVFEVPEVQADLDAGSEPRLVLHLPSGPKPTTPFQPHPDPVRFGQAVEE